jgi:membrane protease YdiL (CAAX protease family)
MVGVPEVFGVPEMIRLVLVVSILICSIWNWTDTWKRYRDGQPLVPATQGDTVPWGLIDLGAIVLILVIIIGLGDLGIQNWAGIAVTAEPDKLSPRDQSIVFAARGTASLVATVFSFAWIYLRFKATPTQLGLSRERLGEDVRLGVRWFTMLIVPMLLVQLLLTKYWKPTEHPLIEMLQQSGNMSLLPVAAYAAIVTAPIFEESLFRLFLQGWLEKLHITIWRNRLGLASKQDRDAVLVGGATSDRLEPPDSPASIGEASAHEDFSNAQCGDRRIVWMPILVSSGLFLIPHMSHGPDWLPLCVLALGLGYLYQRTRRIQACIVVHLLVNTVAILELWSAMRQPTW